MFCSFIVFLVKIVQYLFESFIKLPKESCIFFFVKVTVKSGHKNMEIMFFTQSFMKEIEEKITKMWLILGWRKLKAENYRIKQEVVACKIKTQEDSLLTSGWFKRICPERIWDGRMECSRYWFELKITNQKQWVVSSLLSFSSFHFFFHFDHQCFSFLLVKSS